MLTYTNRKYHSSGPKYRNAMSGCPG